MERWSKQPKYQFIFSIMFLKVSDIRGFGNFGYNELQRQQLALMAGEATVTYSSASASNMLQWQQQAPMVVDMLQQG